MTGIKAQTLGVHYGDLVTYPHQRSIDRQDYSENNIIEYPHEFRCTDVVHFTENQFAAKIGLLGTDKSFCFQA